MSRLLALAAVLLALLAGAVCLGGVGTAAAAPADDHLTVGLKAFQDQFYSLAAKELWAFLAAEPESPRRAQVLAVLSRAEIGQENWDGARRALEQLRGARADSEDALYWLAWVAARQGDVPAAVGYAEQYDGLPEGAGKRRGDVLELAARTAWQGHAFADAARLYGRFLHGVPGDARRPAMWAGRVAALEQAGESPAQVLRAVDDALGEGVPVAGLRVAVAEAGVRAARTLENPRREAQLWRVLAGVGGDPVRQRRARLETGLASERAGDLATAEKALLAFLGQNPAGEAAVRAHLALADLARRRQDSAAALVHLEAVLALPKADRATLSATELHRGALVAALQGGDEKAAAVHAAALLANAEGLSPAERGAAHLLLGRRLADQEPAAAVEHLLAVPEGPAGYRDARLAAATLLTATGHATRALEVLQPFLERARVGADLQRVALAAAEAAENWAQAAQLADALASAAGAEEGRALLRRAAEHWLRAGEPTPYEEVLVRLAAGDLRDGAGRWAAAELQRLTFARGEWEAAVAWGERARGEGTPAAGVDLRQAAALEQLGRDVEALPILAAVATRVGESAGAALARIGALQDRAGRWQPAAAAYAAALVAGLPDAAAGWVRQRLGELSAASPAPVPSPNAPVPSPAGPGH